MRFVYWLWLVPVACANVTVLMCCERHQRLQDAVCVEGGKPGPWAPVIYSPSNKGFLEPGTTPPHWTLHRGRPPCAQPTLVRALPGNMTPNYVLFDTGALYLQDYEGLVEPGGFCVDSGAALACLDGGEAQTRVRKCCGQDAVYSEVRRACVALTPPHAWDFLPEGVVSVAGFPVCAEAGSYVLGGKLGHTHHLLPDGSLRLHAGPDVEPFCLERVLEHPEEPATVFSCPTRHRHHHDHDLRYSLYPMGLFLSVFFLAVTLIASCLLPSTYHVLHWRCQTNHVACLLVGDLLLAITQISHGALQGPFCVLIAVCMHFLFLAAFFWLNTMCFNIWWTFRDLRPANLDKGQETCRLRMYELYAWGGASLIAGLAVVMDQLPEEAHPNLARPRFGQQRCWFHGDTAMLFYFYGPVGFLLLLNLTLFAATARELTCGLWKTEVVKSNTERATLGRVCLKLVIVMGITWVADVLSWVVGGPMYLWYLTDIINTMQGVLIFAVVGCQPQVWAAVKRLWCLRQETRSEGANVRSSTCNATPSVGADNNSTTTKPVETLC